MNLIFVCKYGRLPITNMFDISGEEIIDPDEAYTVVAKLPDGQWLAAKVFIGEIENGSV